MTVLEFFRTISRLFTFSDLRSRFLRKLHFIKRNGHNEIIQESENTEPAGVDSPSCQDSVTNEPDEKEAKVKAKPNFLDPKIIEEFIKRSSQAKSKETATEGDSKNTDNTQRQDDLNSTQSREIHQTT